MFEPLVLQLPDGPAPQLVLLFHGFGASPVHMAGLGQQIAAAFPQAAVISLPGRDACGPDGFQWFALDGITEDNRAARVAEAMPEFVATVRRWQHRTGASVAATALIGFSQGAIMALESTQVPGAPPLAGRIVALSGRFAVLPEAAPPQTTLHLVHGKDDPVIPYRHAVQAAERLIALGGDVTADVIPFLGHTISLEVMDLVLERLTGYIPQRLWREAMASAPREETDD